MKRILIVLLLLTGINKQETFAQYLLKNATIITGNARLQPRTGNVYVREDKIVKVDYQQRNDKPGYTVIDCTGKFIMPGVMDAHVHLATQRSENEASELLKTRALLKNMIAHGITTVRDMAGNAEYLGKVARQINTGKFAGPDIYYAAQFAGPDYFKMIQSSGREDSTLGNSPWYRSITASTDMKQVIAEAKAAGVSGIKVYADLSADLVKKISKEAHRQGLQVWCHGTIYPAKPLDAIRAHPNSMSHAADIGFQQFPGDTLDISEAWDSYYKGFVLDTALQVSLMKMMKQYHIYLDPTLYHAANNKLTHAAAIAKIAHSVGVAVVTGTDWIYPEGPGKVPLEDELKELIHKCGFSNLEAIQATTWNSARVTGLEDRGLIKKGMKADILILDKDPLEDISAIFTPQQVMKNGIWIKDTL
ncbi:hydrolase [Chitinophaga caeni]|uniref:Hydrolase n=1 Tax=Chitinophaga caeni TaxID=2029983 RepID=A0A291QNZ0_9BACT|nr:amidohydrolase family protein [Chitinophaga caeni]ATL45678.1 hydrolase [Chitinophaga caeni]